jgi:hypothetical protein
MDEFNDSDISSLLNNIAGSSPDTMMAHKVVLGKVRRVRQRRVVAVSAAAVVMVVSGAVAMVQKSNGRDGGSNIAVPLSPDDSQPIKVATTVNPLVTTTTIDGDISVDPIVTNPPAGTPSTQPSSNSSTPSNSGDATTTTPTNTQVPTNSQGPSITTTPSNNPAPTTSRPPATTPVTTPPVTKAPIVTSPPVNSPPSTQAPITQPPLTSPPTTIPDVKTWTCGGGSARYLVTSSGLLLIETTTAVGFEISENQSKADEIVVKFISKSKNDERKSVLKIKKSALVSTSCEDEGFNRRSDTSNSGSTDHSSSDNNEESADD